MEFGKIDVKLLDKTDLSLPKDHPQTKSVLAKSKPPKKMEVYVGCAKWGRPDWVGKIYPRGTKPANFLDEYAKHFNSIEFNSIFYGLPTKEQMLSWKNKTGKGFLFCPKFTEAITHRRRLKNAQEELDAFFSSVHLLEEKLGPIFLMPHPQMGAKHEETILNFLDSLPKDISVFTEFRHEEWYVKENADRIFSALEKRKRGTIITDTAGRRDCVHMRLTTPETFIRFVGNSLHKSDYKRIDDWVKRIKLWMNAGLKRCYFFMHQHDERYSPELCKYLIEQLNKHCGLDLKVPVFVTETKPSKKQAELF